MTDNELIRRDLDVELLVRAPVDGQDERIIEGIVVPWGQPAMVRSVGLKGEPPKGTPYRESIVRGATDGLDPERVKLESTRHDGALVGRGITAEDRPEGLHMALRVAKTSAGDELLELAREKVLTSMSIVFAPVQERMTPDGVERTKIAISRVAVLEAGAYDSAQVSAVRAADEPTPKPPKQEKKVDQDYTTQEEKADRASELTGVITRMATEYPGVMPADAQARYDDAKSELKTLHADMAAWASRQKDIESLSRQEQNVEAPEAPHFIMRKTEADVYDMNQFMERGPQRAQHLRDNAMRSVDSATLEHPNADPQKHKSEMQWLLDNKDTADSEIATRMLVTGSPLYKRAFNKTVLGLPLTPEEAQRAAALQVVGTTTTGGYAIPYTFDPTFIHTGAYTNINPYRGICRVEQIAGSNNWQGVSVGAIAAVYDAESAATTEGGPTFARPSLTAQRASAFVTLSRETLQDRPDIGSELASLINEGKETNEEAQFSVGVGTTVFPQGVALAAAFTVTTTITNDVFAVADLDKIELALPIRHRRDAVWLFSRSVIRVIQGFETAYGKLFNSTLGYPAVGNINNTPGGNTGMNLLGYPVYETPSIPVTVTTDAAIVGVFFNPSQYLILDRIGMDVEVVPNIFDATTGFPNGNRGLLAIWRNTARVLNADGGRQMKIQ